MRWAADHRFGIWGFCVAVAFVPGIMSAAYSGRWAVIALGIPLMGPINFQFIRPVQIALGLSFVWGAVSMLVALDIHGAQFDMILMVLMIGVMSAAAQMESLDNILTGLCWGVGVSSVFCAIAIVDHPLVEQGSLKYAGLFYNSEVLTELAAPLFVWAMISRKFDMVAATILPLIVNGQRIAVLAAGIALLYGYRRIGWKYILGIVVLMAVALTAVMASRADNIFGSIAQRIVIWLETIMAFTPMGHGVGWFRAVHPESEFAHSDVIQAIAEFGIGAALFAVIPIMISFRNRGSNAERACFVAICIEGILSFPLHVPASAFLIAVVSGYLVRSGGMVRRVGFDGGIHDGSDHQWAPADAGNDFRRSRPVYRHIPIRSAAEGIPPLVACRSSEA